jgi:circadian clock protein KaiB
MNAYANLTKLCEEHVHGHYQIEVIDLAEQPSLARSEDIVAIPTVVRRLPTPVRKFIGDLSDTERVLVELRLRPTAEPS